MAKVLRAIVTRDYSGVVLASEGVATNGRTGRSVARFGQLDHVHRRLVPAFPARLQFQCGLNSAFSQTPFVSHRGKEDKTSQGDRQLLWLPVATCLSLASLTSSAWVNW